MCNDKDKEEKIPHELSADELGDVTGGTKPQEFWPADFVKCIIMDSVLNPRTPSLQGEFCKYVCEYNRTRNCEGCYHSPSISDAYLREKYEAFEKKYNSMVTYQ